MPFRALILNNFWLKFFSIALATVIWMAIHYSIEHDFNLRELDVKHLVVQKYTHVPVSIVATPGDSRLFRVAPNQVEVIAMAEESVLRGVSQTNITVHVDLTEIEARSASDIELHADVPRDVTLVSINPPVVNVEVISK